MPRFMWKVHDQASIFVLRPYTMHELRNQNISIGRQFKRARFWDADGNRKWAISTFNLSSQNHVHIAKYLFLL